METQKKLKTKLYIYLTAFIVMVMLAVLIIDKNDLYLEQKIMHLYDKKQEKLQLKQPVYVVNIGRNGQKQIISGKEEFQKISSIINTCSDYVQGIYLLDLKDMEESNKQQSYYSYFQKCPKVFSRYFRNIHHESDEAENNGLLQFVDDSSKIDDRFFVMSKNEAGKRYLPYYYMKFSGNKLSYDKEQQQYTVRNASEKKGTLYSLSDGSIYIKKANKKKVHYCTLDQFYNKVQTKNASDLKDAIIFIQDGISLSNYYDNENATEETLADFYIDVMATLSNYETVPILPVLYKLLLICCVIIVTTLIVLVFPYWISIPVISLGLFHVVIFQKSIYLNGAIYAPIIELVTVGILTAAIVIYGKDKYRKMGLQYLPMNAVVKFTNNIAQIDNSVSYSSYLLKNRKEIEAAIQAVVILPYLDEQSFIFKQLAEEKSHNKRFMENHFANNREHEILQVRTKLFHGIKVVAFIPLPVFDKDKEEQMYTAIGLQKKLGHDAAEYISMLLLSMYIYFRAQHERGAHQKMYFSMLSLIISVIDAKDPVTAGHSQRVANISKDIGIWLKLNKKQQSDLEFTALLHDIGKIGVSDYVLNKPSVFTQADFEQMKHHTVRGAEMLSEVGISSEIIDGVRHHHERMDGKGYPDGIIGDQLSLFAKIIKIADVYDALTSKRQYKEAWEVNKALDIIYHGRGTEFDADIADVFIEHMKPFDWQPSTKDNKRNYSGKDITLFRKVIHITYDFYSNYSKFISLEYPIPSRAAKEIDFSGKSGFMNYDWGETFNNEDFLAQKPLILDYEKDTQSLVFGQCSQAKEVRNIYYYFFKGFINMGLYLIDPRFSTKIQDILQENFGDAVLQEKQFTVFRHHRFYVVLFHTPDEKCIVTYISDYMCSNYQFNQ